MLATCAVLNVAVLNVLGASAGPNLLRNAGFEEPADNTGDPPHWSTAAGSNANTLLTKIKKDEKTAMGLSLAIHLFEFSPQKAVIAKHIWDESRVMLRQPTRWESRRTLYFFEP